MFIDHWPWRLLTNSISELWTILTQFVIFYRKTRPWASKSRKNDLLSVDCVVWLKLVLRLPENMRLGPLSDAHVNKINTAWPHRYDGSEKFISYSVKYHMSIGLFDVNDDLVAWSLRYENGSLGVLQVDENHLRKGYGNLIAKALSKSIAVEDDCDVTAQIVKENVKSLNMFSKLGFKPDGPHSWYVVTLK